MEFLTLFLLFGAGAVAASFVAVVAERIHTGQSWSRGRSRCNSCAVPLHTRDLVPVLSWMLALGRCRTCHARVSARYAVAELTLGTLFVLAYLHLGLTAALVPFLIALSALLFVVLYDLRHTVVPQGGSMLLVAAGAMVACMTAPDPRALGLVLLLAGGIGLAFFLLFFLSRGRAMGLGDAPVALALSLLVGQQAPAGLLLSFWIGAAVGIAILVLRRGGPTMGIEIPFVPFLAAGYLLAYFTQWNPLGLM